MKPLLHSARRIYPMLLDAMPPMGVGPGTLLGSASLILLLFVGCGACNEGSTAEGSASAGPPTEQEMFGPEMVKNLPEPARRFLSRAIAPGMPLADSVELEMHGALPWRRTGILCQLWSLIPLVRGDGPDVGDEAVETTLEVDADGRPVRAVALRWSERAGPDYEPFVVELSGELRAEGYTVPSRIEAAWSLGEGDEFRFFEATLDRATFR